MSVCINIYLDEGNIGILSGKMGTVLEIKRWDPGSSHQLLNVYRPQLSQGTLLESEMAEWLNARAL